MSFVQDLKNGKKAEEFVISIFEKHGWVCNASPARESGYDFVAEKDGCLLKFEVKNDILSVRTGNLAIEYWNPKKNKQSGLTVTKADFWVYCFGEPWEAYFVALKSLLEYIDENEPHKIVDVGGDKNASLLLYRKEEILKNIFWRIDDLGPESFRIGLSFYLEDKLKDFERKAA